jgi:hypothetical protein
MAGGNNLKDNSTESVTQVAITKRPSSGKEKYAYRQYDSIGKDGKGRRGGDGIEQESKAKQWNGRNEWERTVMPRTA